MEYEIAEIDAVDNDDTLLVEVHVWHADFARGLGAPPDVVYHHKIQHLPPPRIRYEEQPGALDYLRPVDGGDPVMAWHEVDGDWVRGPAPADIPRLTPLVDPDEERAAMILAVVDEHVPKVATGGVRDDRYPPGQLRKLNRGRAIGNRGPVKALKGHRKRR